MELWSTFNGSIGMRDSAERDWNCFQEGNDVLFGKVHLLERILGKLSTKSTIYSIGMTMV